MPIPVRLVCAYCLSSVEASADGDPRSPATCPSCGSPIEAAYGSGSSATVSSRPRSWSPSSVDMTPQVASEAVPATIGRFVLGERLGGGGYGEVFRAVDPRLERHVALKILKGPKADTKAAERFLREARAAAKLDHPNIVAIHDAGQDDGRLWIAYRLVEGRTLSQLRDERGLGHREAVALVRDLALALDHAHRRGVTHRDLKPANVLVDGQGRPHLTDFGLARRLDLDSELTAEGTVLGTPAYMSPEQAAGRAHLADGRSDIYSLGVILYELLCGRRPCDAPSGTPFWKVDHTTPPPTPHSLDRAIPRDLDRACMKALATRPSARYQEAGEFARVLDEWLAREGAGITSRRTLTGLAGVGLVATIALVVVGAPGRGRPRAAVGEDTPILAPVGGVAQKIHRVLKPPAPEPAPAPKAEPPPPGPSATARVEPAPARVEPAPSPTRTPVKAAEKPAPPADPPLKRAEREFFAIILTAGSGTIHRSSCPLVQMAESMNSNVRGKVVEHYLTYEEAQRHSRTRHRCPKCKP